ncbi:hypothetical protein PENTCL1PPCAC_2067 [Pristionchus entomophagus]|uniref:Uncharacterized protein n=1 Tax=Pristionchus entomophagus TaxID=358040 RepID=A0AAV5SBP0_9BILA|nr:hypothetical protein PENTCL1PPCAC_2067 [Pristionchus entomophagus]
MAGEILFQSVKEFVVYLAQSVPGIYLFWSTIGAMIFIVSGSIWKACQEERTPSPPTMAPPLPPIPDGSGISRYVAIDNESSSHSEEANS